MTDRDTRFQQMRDMCEGGRILPDRDFSCRECGGTFHVEGGWYPDFDTAHEAIKQAGADYGLADLDGHPSLRDFFAANGQPQPDGRPWRTA